MDGVKGSRGYEDLENEFINYLKSKSFDDDDIDMIIHRRGDLGLKWHKIMWKKFNSKKVKLTREKYLFLTLSPDKISRNLLPTEANCRAVNEWTLRWLNNNVKFYGKDPEYKYILEGGSNNDHLHVHIVVKLYSSHKHAEKLKANWAKYFPNNQLLTSLFKNRKNPANKRGEYCSFSFDDPEVLQDKLDYLENELKGSHENEIDLGFGGQRGFITDRKVNLSKLNPNEIIAESKDSTSTEVETINFNI